jgi:hypothetical protein
MRYSDLFFSRPLSSADLEERPRSEAGEARGLGRDQPIERLTPQFITVNQKCVFSELFCPGRAN